MSSESYNFSAMAISANRPLYGHVGDCMDGEVPKWVRKPTLSLEEVHALFDIDGDDDLPDGVTMDGEECTVDREVYLEQIQDRQFNADNFDEVTITFELHPTDEAHQTNRPDSTPVPKNIRGRLNGRLGEQMSASDDPEETTWLLVYEIGGNGRIKNVEIEDRANL